ERLAVLLFLQALPGDLAAVQRAVEGGELVAGDPGIVIAPLRAAVRRLQKNVEAPLAVGVGVGAAGVAVHGIEGVRIEVAVERGVGPLAETRAGVLQVPL